MQVKNTTGVDRYVPAVGLVVAAGDSVDIDDKAGASLIEQGWKKHTPAKKADEATPQED